MRLPPETRKRLVAELDALNHLTRAEQSIRHDARVSGTVKRGDVRDLIAEFVRLPSAYPTSGEREIITLYRANS